MLVAVDVSSTAARCGLWKPLPLHPPTVHLGLRAVWLSLYLLLSYLELGSLWMNYKSTVNSKGGKKVMCMEIVGEE